MTTPSAELSIGQIAKRAGVAVSAVRYYADEGLIIAHRNAGGHRRFARAQLRRISFVLIAQQFGLTLPQIKTVLSQLPDNRTPTAADWATISMRLKEHLNARIQRLETMRDKLDGCIGCGCLSLKTCTLYNPEDILASKAGAAPTGRCIS